MERNDKGMMLGFGLVLLLVPLVLWEPAVALTTSPPAFTDRKAGDFGMASEYLENFNQDGDAWVTTGTDYFIIYQYNGNGYDETNITRPQTSGTWGIFGFDVTCGDYNGDGYGDVIVSDPYWNDPQSIVDCGTLVCYFSNNNPISAQTSAILVEGVNQDGLGGYSIDTGNFDGDDYDDLIVGEPGYIFNNSIHGQVHIFLGCSNPGSWGSLSSSDWSVDGTSGDGNWGVCVRGIKDDDDNNDYDNFCISHSDTSGSSTPYSNKISIYYGDSDIPSLSQTPSLTIIPQNLQIGTPTDYGLDVDSGDYNGDGYNDIASITKLDQPQRGKTLFYIVIYLGSSNGYSSGSYYNYHLDWEAWSSVTDFKYEIATQGNDNGDSYDDIASSIYYYGPPPGVPPLELDDRHMGIRGNHGESPLNWSSYDWIIGVYQGDDLSMGLFHGKSLNGVYEQTGDSKDDLIVGSHQTNQIDLYEGD